MTRCPNCHSDCCTDSYPPMWKCMACGEVWYRDAEIIARLNRCAEAIRERLREAGYNPEGDTPGKEAP